MIRRAALSLAAMVLTLVATSGMALAHETALAQVGGTTCAAGSCWGTPGDDLMIGTPYSNGLHGLRGDDLIIGLGGKDFLTGDNGNDAVHGDSGDDWVEGNAGGDLVTGGQGDDRVVGGSEGDVLRGGSGADLIVAQDGFVDLISCGAGRGDLVRFDRGLDRVAADCEAPRALCPSKFISPYVTTYAAARAGGDYPCDGLCECKGCRKLRRLRANGHCVHRYYQQCG
jgi:hypothetical protein